MTSFFKVINRSETPVSPWVRLVAKEVRSSEKEQTHVYHSLAVADYVVVIAMTSSGLIPVVSQFRPAVEAITWELPAGLRDGEESPEETCRRELKEETGLDAVKITALASWFTDTGRLENRLHVFFAETGDCLPSAGSEEGIRVQFVKPETLLSWIQEGKFALSMHIAAFLFWHFRNRSR